MDLRIPERKFVCIDYPAIVQNHEVMLQTLGGPSAVTKTYCDPSKRLELSFRRKDVGCKPLFGDRQTCKGLLIRVRRRRRQDVSSVDTVDKQQRTDETCSAQIVSDKSQSSNGFQYSAEVIGMVDTVYRFQSLSDFQYLMADRDSDGSYRDIHEQVYLTGLQSRSWLDEQAPLCLLPPMFSRFDHPVMYCYRDPPVHRIGYEKALPKLDPNVIGISRKRRPHHTRFVAYNEKVVPSEPNASAVQILQNKRVPPTTVDRIKKMFDEKPVWSRSALAAYLSSSLPMHVLSAALPALAYFFNSGPWRSTWVRFGYDPRTDPHAKIYQTLDVRVPRTIPDDSNKISKRSVLPYRAPHTRSRSYAKPAVIQRSVFDTSQTGGKDTSGSTAVSQDPRYRFRPGILPAYRQMFYQLCYVDEPEVQRLVHDNDGQETECSEKDGWCRPETLDKCRAIITAHITSSTLPASTATDVSSVKSTPAVTEDNESSGSELEPNDDDIDEERFSSNNEQNDDDDDEGEDADDSEQLEASIIKQLGPFS